MGDHEILIDRSPGECRAAILRQGRLAELFVERASHPWRRHAIVLARVIDSGRKSGRVFVDLGGAVGVLEGHPAAPLVEGGSLLVEILAEAYGGKAAKVTGSPALRGHLLTLTPSCPGRAVSRRIRPRPERDRLRAAVAGSLPETMGSIIRTAAQGCDEAAVQAEAQSLLEAWRALNDHASSMVTPAVLVRAPGPLEIATREYPDAPILESRDGALFRTRQVDAAIDDAVDNLVRIDGGGSLVFEETEALTAIDVNIAGALGNHGSPERFASAVARELIWQIRLRQLVGLLIVDFPRFRKTMGRDGLVQDLGIGFAAMSNPPVVHGWTRTGLLEVTRERHGPTLAQILLSRQPERQRSPETIALEALRRLLRDSRGIARPILVCPTPVRHLLLGSLRKSLDETARRLGGAIAVEAGVGDAIEIRETQTG